MSVARGDKAVAVLNGKLHVVGGESKNQDGHSTPLMDVEVRDLGLLLCWVCPSFDWLLKGNQRESRRPFLSPNPSLDK